MKLNLEDDFAIKRYLLGELTEEDQQQLEERLLTENEYFERLQLIEDELVDEYLGGGLSPAEREKFDSHFLSTPERYQKLRIASALRRYVSAAALVEEPEPVRSAPPPTSPWQLLKAFLWGQNPVLGYFLAAALLLIVLGGTWSMVSSRRLQNQLEWVKAQQSTSEQELQRQLGEQRARGGQLAEELEREKHQRAVLEEEKRSLITSLHERLGPSTLSLALTPGLVRGTETTKKLSIPSSGSLIRFELQSPGDDFKSYTASLHNDEGDEIVTRYKLKARPMRGSTVVVMNVTSEDVPQGDYYVQLSGITDSGKIEELDKYFFRIIKK